MRETLVTNAKKLVQGMTHFVEDMENSGDLLEISQTDTEPWRSAGISSARARRYVMHLNRRAAGAKQGQAHRALILTLRQSDPHHNFALPDIRRNPLGVPW
ncbi:MAG TPA: hypothetical protein VIG52_01110 [Methyloceanibacter sp.]